MQLQQVAKMARHADPLCAVELPVPEPEAGELRIRVSACGVCHTELDEIEGRTSPPVLPVVPGHEVVGYVDKLGADVQALTLGQRVGVGWIHSSSGEKDENLSPDFKATGRDVNGGYAEYMTVPARYAFSIPDSYADAEAAPMLCAGGVGYRALLLTRLQNGQALGLTGFGGCAHLVLQLVRKLFPDTRVYVFARDPEARALAKQLGATWTADTTDESPELLHAIIDTTPAWQPVISALGCLRPGGCLIINAIRKQDEDKSVLQTLDFAKHLWLEKEIKSVANVTAHDIAAFLKHANDLPIQPMVEVYPLEQANTALRALKFDRVTGAKVLEIT